MREELRLGRGAGDFFSPVLEGLLSGKKNMQNKGGGDVETGAKDFQRGGSQTWLGRVALHPGWNGFFGGRKERSNRGTDSVARSIWVWVVANRPPLLVWRSPSRLTQKKRREGGVTEQRPARRRSTSTFQTH